MRFLNPSIALIFGCVVCLIAQAQSSISPEFELSPKAKAAVEFIKTGLRFEHAEGVDKDFVRAHDFYCAAARLDSAEAFIRLGWMYANGRGFTRSDAIANTMFKRAADLGDDMGQRLAEMIKGSGPQSPPCLTAPVGSAAYPNTNLQRSTAAEQRTLNTQAPLPVLPKVTPTSFSQLTAIERVKFAQSVASLAKEFKIDPRLVMAVMRAESNFDPLARSPKGAQGLMQLIPETAERFAVKDINEPTDNIRGGMAYLKWLLSLFRGNVVLSLAAYNAGEKTVDRFGGVPPYPETMAYVQRIRSLYPVDFHAFDERAAAYRFDRKPSKK